MAYSTSCLAISSRMAGATTAPLAMPSDMDSAAVALLGALRSGRAAHVAQLLQHARTALTMEAPALFAAADAALAATGEPLLVLHLAARADGGVSATPGNPGGTTEAGAAQAVALLLDQMPAKEVDRLDGTGLTPVRVPPCRCVCPARSLPVWREGRASGKRRSCRAARSCVSRLTRLPVLDAAAPRLPRRTSPHRSPATRARRGPRRGVGRRPRHAPSSRVPRRTRRRCGRATGVARRQRRRGWRWRAAAAAPRDEQGRLVAAAPRDHVGAARGEPGHRAVASPPQAAAPAAQTAATTATLGPFRRFSRRDQF